jgi:hypothetical protein
LLGLGLLTYYPPTSRQGIVPWLFYLGIHVRPALEPAIIKFWIAILAKKKIAIHYHINILKGQIYKVYSSTLTGILAYLFPLQIRGLYKGASSSFIGIAVESSLFFGTYSQAKQLLQVFK